jgi:hypothetical protein
MNTSTVNVIETKYTEADYEKLGEWLKAMLHQGPATVTFTKKDGTERVMNCTLEASQLPVVELKEGATPRKESTTSLRVFDLDKKEWRSFVIKSIKRVELSIGLE